MKTHDSTSFGLWLSRQRKARDLTQEDLAERIGCSVWTIQKIELGSRRPSKQVAEILTDYLDIPTEDRAAFLQFARGRSDLEDGTDQRQEMSGEWMHVQQPTQAQGHALVAPASHPPSHKRYPTTNLTAQLTSFVGRDVELPRIRDLMLSADVRLLTLTGPPGTGKTRLALQVAARLLEEGDFADGVFFVNLASISDPGLVISEIAQTLSVREGRSTPLLEGVEGYLRDKRLLLVLDNFEQVVEAAPAVGELLGAASRVKALVTSRVPLHIRGEKVFSVPPLQLPDTEHLPPLDRLSRYEAVRLFVERATDIKADFEITDANAAALAHICARLDGLPLAIELTAARVKYLSSQAILTRLESRLELLTGGPRDLPARQRTLRSAIEWSYDLLDEEEKRQFRSLAVFQGGRSLAAIEAVCNLEGISQTRLLDVVSSLVDKGLLRQEEGAGGECRFVMLETIHEFAREKLAEADEVATEEPEGQDGGEAYRLRKQHALYFMMLAEEAEPGLKGPHAPAWLEKLEEEHDNFRAALEWSQTAARMRYPSADRTADAPGSVQDVSAIEIGLRLAGALGLFWYARGYYSEGRQRLTAMISEAEVILAAQRTALDTPPIPRKHITHTVQDVEGAEVGEGEHTDQRHQRVRMLLRAYAKALETVGWLAISQADYALGHPLLEQSLAIAKQLGDRALIARSLARFAAIADETGDYASARNLYGQSLQLHRKIGDKAGIWAAVANLGFIDTLDGQFEAARPQLEEALAIARDMESQDRLAAILTLLGWHSYYERDYVSARALCEQSLAMFSELKNKQWEMYALVGLGMTAFRVGKYDEATVVLGESLRLAQDLGSKKDLTWSLPPLAGVANARGQPERAVRLFAVTEALCEATGHNLWPVQRAEVDRDIAAARAQLDDKIWQNAWDEGRDMK